MAQANYRLRIKRGYNPGVYYVESRTRWGLAHMCNVLTGRCTCEAGKKGRGCWHMDFCRRIEDWKAGIANTAR